MRSNASFLAAAWIYFAYAMLFLLSVGLAPWLTERKVTVGLVVVGGIFIGICLGLGAWSWQAARGRPKAGVMLVSCAMFPVILGGLTPGFTASIIFGLPFTLVAWGTRQVQLAGAAQSNEAARDG